MYGCTFWAWDIWITLVFLKRLKCHQMIWSPVHVWKVWNPRLGDDPLSNLVINPSLKPEFMCFVKEKSYNFVCSSTKTHLSVKYVFNVSTNTNQWVSVRMIRWKNLTATKTSIVVNVANSEMSAAFWTHVREVALSVLLVADSSCLLSVV